MDAKITEALRVVELALEENTTMPVPRNEKLNLTIQNISMKTALRIVRRLLTENQVNALRQAHGAAAVAGEGRNAR